MRSIFIALVFATLLVVGQTDKAMGAFQKNGDRVQPFKLKEYPVVGFIGDYASMSNSQITIGARLLKKIKDKKLTLSLNSPLSMVEFKNLFYGVLRNYGLILHEDENFAAVIEERDIRYMPTKISSGKEIDPGKEQYVMASLRTKYPLASEISRNLRPFLSRYARVISLSDARLLLIQDTQKNIATLIKIIDAMDTNQAYQSHLESRKNGVGDKAEKEDLKILGEELDRVTLENLKLKKQLQKQKGK